MTMYVRDGGSWKAVQSTGLYVRDGGSWKQVKQAWVRDGGSWKQFHIASDPLTLNFYPVWTQSYAEDGHQVQYTFPDPADDLVQGDWDTVGHEHGTQRASGLIRFDHSAIASAFGGRTKVTYCALRLTNMVSYTSYGTYPRIAAVGGPGIDNTKASTWGHAHGGHAATGARTKEGNTVTTQLSNVVGSGFITGSYRAILLHDWGDGTGNADKEYYRSVWYGAGASSSIRPMLTITADFQ